MKNCPFNKENDPEGTPAERFEIRHALEDGKTPVPDTDVEWERLRKRLNIGDDPSTDESAYRSRPGRRRLRIALAAAGIAAVVACVVALWPLLPDRKPVVEGADIYIAHVPEVTEVTVTSGSVHQVIESGDVSAVSLAEVSSRTAAASEREKPEMLVFETPAGKELRITLSDSTRIWMWPDTRIEIPSFFVKSEPRVVKVKGQAFFDVAGLPEGTTFTVETPYFNTCVYGTEFCVTAIDSSDASVTLVDGSIAVTVPGDSGTQTLHPGQRALIEAYNSMTVEDIDTYPVEQWRDGYFYFDASLRDILIALGRWYNVNVVSDNHAALDQQLHFVAERTMSLYEIVDDLSSLLTNITINFDGRQITVAARQ